MFTQFRAYILYLDEFSYLAVRNMKSPYCEGAVSLGMPHSESV